MNPPGRAAGGFHWQATPEALSEVGFAAPESGCNLKSANTAIYPPAENDIPYLGYVAEKIAENDHTM